MSLRDIIIDVIPDSFVNSWINHIGQTLSTLTSCHTYWVHINSIDNERSLYRTGDILKWIPHTKHSIIAPPSPATAHLLVIMKPRVWQHRPISQIPQCTSPKSHNAPFCNINVNICAHFCYKMVHCGIFAWCMWDLWDGSIGNGFQTFSHAIYFFYDSKHIKYDTLHIFWGLREVYTIHSFNSIGGYQTVPQHKNFAIKKWLPVGWGMIYPWWSLCVARN